MQPRLFILTCLITCFLSSCKESSDGERSDLSALDSINKAIVDPGSVASEEEALEPIKADTFPDEKISTLSQVNRRLAKRAYYFMVKTNRDTVIRCKEGTLLFIPADAFLSSSGKNVAGEVKISVKEFYKISDMLMEGLTTTSNDQLLETGGMIKIKVTSKETKDSCILKPGKNMTIAMPNSREDNLDGMQLFNGVHDSTHMNWMPRAGANGLAQGWWPGRSARSLNPFTLNAGFVFPDDNSRKKPQVINSKPENLQARINLTIRDLMHHVGLVTQKANGYIDTAGNLHCYTIGYTRQHVTFTEVYSPMTCQDMKVNLGVDVKVSYRSPLNHDYYRKLFKMKKGNPDSLIAVTATLNPVIKLSSVEKIKTVYSKALTVKEYQKKQRYRDRARQEYEKKLQQLRLDSETKLINAEKEAGANLQSAQNYFLLSTPQLGWINCDRFYNNPAKTDYFVNLKEKASLIIVFNSIKAIISSDSRGVFAGVPLNEKITIVGLKTQDGKLMMALHETTVTEQGFEGLSFKPVTVREYKARLEKLNKL